MNLQDFIDYRDICPCCGVRLTTSFHSQKKQYYRYEDNKMLVIFDMPPLNKKDRYYKVGYYLDLLDNSFYIDFYDKNLKSLICVPMSLINRFRNFNDNLDSYKLYRHCSSCNGYLYSSNYFKLDFINLTFGDLSIFKEQFMYLDDCSDGYQMFSFWQTSEEAELIIHHIFPSEWKFVKDNLLKALTYKSSYLPGRRSDINLSIKPTKIKTIQEYIKKIKPLLIFS